MSTMMRRATRPAFWGGLASLLLLTASGASAETLLMPSRDFRMDTSEVVWGVTTQANGTALTLDYGDGSTPVTGTVVDQSYIAFNHTYAIPGTYTVRLTVAAEEATAEVTVYNTAAMSAFDARTLNLNRMIQDGLRFLWTQQQGPNGETRAANFPLGAQAAWGRYPWHYTALVTTAFERHGYRLPADPAVAPTGLFEKYIVRRGLNYVLNSLSQLNLTMQPAGNPCVGSGAGPDPDGAGAALCVGLQSNQKVRFFPGTTEGALETALAIMPFSSSGALNRVVAEIPGTFSNGYVVGKTYGEVLQRMVNAMAWGQTDTRFGRGGWWVWFNDTVFTAYAQVTGYAFPALLEAAEVGAAIPSFVKPEWARNALVNGINDDGSFDYGSDGYPSVKSYGATTASTGVGLQGMFFANRQVADYDVRNALRYMREHWPEVPGQSLDHSCSTNKTLNKGCAESMFQIANGLRFYGVETLPGIGRPAGPGGIPADDWYADYVDWLLANQTNPTTPTGGHWAALDSAPGWSDVQQATALAELILAPIAAPVPAGALKLEAQGQWDFAVQSVPVTPGVSYIAGAYVKGGTVKLQAYTDSAPWTEISSTYCTGGSTAYVWCSFAIANPPDNAIINLAVFDSTGGSTVYVDDVSVTAAAGGPNLAPNSGFSSSTGLGFTSPSPFVVSAEGGRVPSTASSGSVQWVAAGTWQFTYQPVSVTPGAAYTVGFAVKGSTAKVQIYSNGSPWTEIAGGYCTGDSIAYRWCSFSFVNPPDNARVNLAIYDAATGGAAGYADDIWLSLSSGGPNLVSDPGFESSGSWFRLSHFVLGPAGGVPKP